MKTIKRFVSVLLALCMIIALVPAMTMEANAADSAWYWPLNGFGTQESAYKKITSSFGYRGYDLDKNGTHTGMDIGAAMGTAVYAARDGTVIVAKTGNSASGGREVVIDHGDGYFSRYIHLNSVNVSVNDVVTINSIIGTVGGSGSGKDNKFSPHLHFEIRENENKSGKAINPCPKGYTTVGDSFKNGGYSIGTARFSYIVDRSHKHNWTQGCVRQVGSA